MRSERLAEAVLSVVASPERASAAVGDLLELAPTRGRIWFWRSILLTALATVWRHFRAAPLMLTFYAALSLVGYSLVILLLVLAGQLLVVLLWIGGALGFNGDSDERALLRTVGPLVIFVVAPYLSGRRIADVWHERAVALTMALAVWLVMLALVPLVAAPGRTMNVPMLLWIVPFMMAGVVRRRLMTLRRSHSPVAE